MGYADRNYRLSHDCHVIIQLALYGIYSGWSGEQATTIPPSKLIRRNLHTEQSPYRAIFDNSALFEDSQ